MKFKMLTFDCPDQHGTHHLIFANWALTLFLSGFNLAKTNRLSLGEVKVDGKSNEITAIPKLLEVLAL
jgi:hypothetical protein